MARIQNECSLLAYNTFGVDVTARYFSEVSNEEELKEVLSDTLAKQNQRVILGGGSNILFTEHVDGFVIKNGIQGLEVVREEEDFVDVEVGAGKNWHQFVLHCVGWNYGGIENLSLIPGNVGAAPIQNIGAYGVELKDVFLELEALDIESMRVVRFSASDCEFGYRDSIFKREAKGRFVITRVRVRLSKKPELKVSYGALEQELESMGGEVSVQAVSQAVINIRRRKLPDPTEVGNAGSFFKNPVVSHSTAERLKAEFPDIKTFYIDESKIKVAAGWMIDKAGWKGYREGNCGVHPNQALVLVNYGGAQGSEILAFSERIREDIKNKFGVELEREVNLV